MNEIEKLLFTNKRWMIGLLILLLACKPSSSDPNVKVLWGSSGGFDRPVQFDLEDIKARGTLKVLIDNSSTSFFIYKGHLMGYEYELLNLMAEDLDVKLELILTPNIGRAFEKLNSGQGDIIAHNLTITKERKKRVAFVDSHYTTRQVLIQKKPQGWRRLKAHEYEKKMIRTPIHLMSKIQHPFSKQSYPKDPLL